jgi:hypothetical protein
MIKPVSPLLTIPNHPSLSYLFHQLNIARRTDIFANLLWRKV